LQNRFFDLLRAENKKGSTVFFSSHNLVEVEKVCDRVAIIKEGKILKIEQIDKLLTQRIKKIKITLSNDKDKNCFDKIEGIKEKKKINGLTEIIYSGKINAIIRYLSEMDIENLSIEDPSLEEVFMHYYENGV